jgi:ribose transport system ATP-binding protein
VAFVMVTHKLAEALELANRIIILRDGRLVIDRRTPLPDLGEVTSILAPGTNMSRLSESTAQSFEPQVLLEFDDVRLGNTGPLNFSLRRGEAVTITGRLGDGLTSVAYLAARKVVPDSGTVRLARGASVAIVPPSREQSGSLGALTVGENLALSSLARRRSRFTRLVDRRREADAVNSSIAALGITPARSYAPMATLSGGNQQKVLFGRALLAETDVIVLGEPTRGVDIGTRQQIYALMRDLKRTGHALLVVASDPHDALAVSDRLFVLGDDGLSAEWRTSDLNNERIVELV